MSDRTTQHTDAGMTGVALRTRTAIVGAAFQLLPKNPNASLNDIAELAGVGRSTLHRHFTDRDDVLLSLAHHIRVLVIDAIARAAPGFGEPDEALRRVVDELIDMGSALIWVRHYVNERRDPALSEEFRTSTEELLALLERATNDSEKGPPLAWRSRVFWEVLRLGSEFTDQMPRQHAIDMIMFTLRRGIVEDPR